jgi:sensor histidine kinase YesM
MIGHTANIHNERFMCGAVDDILFYRRVLTRGEVAELYNAPNPHPFSGYYKWLVLLPAIALVSAAIHWGLRLRFRRKLREEKERHSINEQLNNMETRALRAQMNPHFIFNSLTTLSGIILREDPRAAHEYLTSFSKLLRKMMESSLSDSILLTEEVEILRRYIELELMRFQHKLEFSIQVKDLIADQTNIPLMMVQPFVENAIWHGLHPKKGDKRLTILFSKVNDSKILCRIEDNGLGLTGNHSRHGFIDTKSLGISFIRQRLAVLNKSLGLNCALTITDKQTSGLNESGTIVEIEIAKLTKK